MSTLKGKSISSTYKNLIQTAAEVTDTNLRSVETGAGNSVAMNLSTDKAEFLKVGIGTGGLAPDGLLHVMSVSAGSVTSNTSANLLTLENSSDAGLSILSGSSSSGNIFFGDADDNDVGLITYDHSTNSMFFGTNGANTMKLDQSGNLNISGVLTEADDRYHLDEYFKDIPYKDIQETEITQASSATNAVTSHTKLARITTVANDLAANDSQEFTFNSNMIYSKSYVQAILVDTSATIADNASVVVTAYDVADGSCKIRIANTGVDIASMTFTIQITIDPHIIVNPNWFISGTNSIDEFLQYGGSKPGVQFFTGSLDNDQMILRPKRSNLGNNSTVGNVSPWRDVLFTPSDQIDLNIGFSTGATITNQAIFAGLNLGTDRGVIADNDDKAYFLYATDDDLGTLTTNANLHFIYSVAGTDFITDLGITVTASTVFKLKISFDENRQISVFVNGVQHGLVTTATAGGATQSVATTKSLAMTSTAELKPYVGIQNLSSTTHTFHVHYVRISRVI